MNTVAEKDLASLESGKRDMTVGGSKVPLPPPDVPASSPVPSKVRDAWIEYMVLGFKNNETMFKRTLEAFMKPYHLVTRLYGVLFAIGALLFVGAAWIGVSGGNSAVAIVFAGLGAGAFLTFFVRQPVQALEENLEFISWMGVAFNTYWTRLMYMEDVKTVQQDLKAADDDYRQSIEQLITKHAELRRSRPGSDVGGRTPAVQAGPQPVNPVTPPTT